MLSRVSTTLVRRTAARYMSSAETVAATSMKLNFSLPHETVYADAAVDQVIIPGESGEYGVTVDHVPIVSQLKPGVLQILFADGEPEKYFVSGGFALTHEDSVTDISCPEAVKVDDIDGSAVSTSFEKAKAAAASAENGSIAEAEAMIEMEVCKAMGAAVGLTLA